MSAALWGLYPAIVTDIVDPVRLGRVQVRLPGLGEVGDDVRIWATLLTPYADNDEGFLAYPAVDTQVMVAFEAGDSTRAYVVGSCWNGRESAPAEATKPNNRRMIRSHEGSVLEFDDSAGAAKVTIKTRSGHELVLDAGSTEVRLTHSSGFGLTLAASGQVRITANAAVDVTAPTLNVHAATAVFDGSITCTTISTGAVISPSYTPGAGNVW